MALPAGILKSQPDHFIVRELVGEPPTPVPLFKTTNIVGPNGSDITCFAMTKRGVATDDAMRQVAKQLGVAPRAIDWFGKKDRHAVTAQVIGVRGSFTPRFHHDNMWLQQIPGDRSNLLRRGENAGNRFEITILSNAEQIHTGALKGFRNLFGVQRCGGPEEPEHIGRLLLLGKFVEAEALILQSHSSRHYENIRRQTSSAKDAFLHRNFSHEFGFRILKWQSWLWNEMVRNIGAAELSPKFPMWQMDSRVRGMYRELWNPHPQDLDPDAIRQLHTHSRPTMVYPDNATFEQVEGGWKFIFDLPSGAYATSLLSQIFDLTEPNR